MNQLQEGTAIQPRERENINQFHVQTRIISGDNILCRLGTEVKSLGVSRLLMVTDKFIESVGLVDKVSQKLWEAGLDLAVFNGVETEPVLGSISIASEMFLEKGCEAVLGLGGGSCIDTAKAVGILSTNPGPLAHYEGEDKLITPPLPVIAVPTTAGTGSEVTGHCVFTDENRKCKVLVSSHLIQPVLAVLDPCLLGTVPPMVAAATGIETLTHAIEAYMSRGATPITDALALDAVKLVSANLPAFVADTQNKGCAQNMQMACVMAALAKQWAGGGAVAAMSHALGGCYNIPHGIASAVLLSHVMKFNLIGRLEKMARIAAALGATVDGLSPMEAAGKSILMVRELNDALGIPVGLRELGVTEDSLKVMSLDVMLSNLLTSNPREASLDNITQIFREAMD